MLRTVVAGIVLMLGLLTSWCAAQTPGAETAPVWEPQAVQPPDLSDRTVSGESVVDLADFICNCLEDGGAVVDWAQVQTTGGRLRRVSAAEVFALFARTVYLWNTSGELPATVPIAPEQVDPPQVDPEDVPDADFDPESGRSISTEQFLAQCADTVYWIDRLHAIPTAVGVNGQRLSAADYLAGLAICIQYAYYEGELLDYIFLPRYTPPQVWVRAVRASREEYAEETGVEEGAELPAEPALEEEVGEEPEGAAVAPLAVEASFLLPPPNPQLVLFPEPGSEVSGIVDLAVAYAGPEPGFVTFGIDGTTRKIMNFRPYGFRWNTSGLPPGQHTVRVRVFGMDDLLLIDQVSIFTVVPPPPPESGSKSRPQPQPTA